jgi:hypothetical protein
MMKKKACQNTINQSKLTEINDALQAMISNANGGKEEPHSRIMPEAVADFTENMMILL